jgi:hypothetical protein
MVVSYRRLDGSRNHTSGTVVAYLLSLGKRHRRSLKGLSGVGVLVRLLLIIVPRRGL